MSDGVEVVTAHHERVTLRVGDGYLKVDADDARLEREVVALEQAPVPTPAVQWRRPHVLALEAVGGRALGQLGEVSTASAAAWRAAGAAARRIHEAPVPAGLSPSGFEVESVLEHDGRWLVDQGLVSADVVQRVQRVAAPATRPFAPVLTHGDLQAAHVFVDGDVVTGIIDWADAGLGDALFDVAVLTVGHEEHLHDVIAGYGADVEVELVRAWWAFRRLASVRWMIEHGFDAVGDVVALERLVTS